MSLLRVVFSERQQAVRGQDTLRTHVGLLWPLTAYCRSLKTTSSIRLRV